MSKVDFSNLGKTTTQPNAVSGSSLPFGITATPAATSTEVSVTPLAVTTPSITKTVIPSVPSTPSYSYATSGVNTTTLAGIAAASGVTINVNSPSVIDEEGFTRAVVTALNNSQARSGGGGGQLML